MHSFTLLCTLYVMHTIGWIKWAQETPGGGNVEMYWYPNCQWPNSSEVCILIPCTCAMYLMWALLYMYIRHTYKYLIRHLVAMFIIIIILPPCLKLRALICILPVTSAIKNCLILIKWFKSHPLSKREAQLLAPPIALHYMYMYMYT